MSPTPLLLLIAGAILAGTCLGPPTASSQPAPATRRTVFSHLKVGQPVTLKERAGLYEVGTVDDGGVLTHKVAEVGDDYIAVRDEAGVAESRIPVTAVRAVTHLKTRPE
ncbi:hypothetical protein J0H58_12755 [bacterium]|nr:hypothetical protein [bacterium]